MNQSEMSALPAGCMNQSEVSALAAGCMNQSEVSALHVGCMHQSEVSALPAECLRYNRKRDDNPTEITARASLSKKICTTGLQTKFHI